MRSQRNKYVWTKREQPNRSNCHADRVFECKSKYKFRRGALKSYEASSPSTRNATLNCKTPTVNFQSIRGSFRPYSRGMSSKVFDAKSGSRYKYVNTIEPAITLPRNVGFRSGQYRNFAKRTLYKYVRGYRDGGVVKSRGKLNVIKGQIDINRAVGYSRYTYVRKGSTCTTRRVRASTTVPGNNVKRRLSQLPTATLRTKKSLSFRRRPMCTSYIMNGMCEAGSDCNLDHDENYVRICPRYLHHRCGLGRFLCPLAHVLDPCRLPVCEFYAKSDCTRVNCPYLHTSRTPDTPICPDFQRGRCPRGRTCSKLHVWLTKKSRKETVPRGTGSSGPSSHVHISPVNQEDGGCVASTTPQTSSSSEAPLFISLAVPDTPVPEGSLRHIYPPPNFIPLMDDEEAA